MSECSGPDCTHESHKAEPVVEKTIAEQMATEAVQNPIITPADTERWPLLEIASQECSIPITPDDEEAIALMDALLNALDDQAAGLAAIQVGYPRRIFLLRNGVNANGETVNNAYLNPVILGVSKETKVDNEACLSLPHMAARFPRPKSVTLQYMDIDGIYRQETFKGFWARAVCHEMDHLNGTLIVTHMQDNLAKQIRRTKFGMKVTPQRQKEIARRRATKQNARRAKRHARAIGR